MNEPARSTEKFASLDTLIETMYAAVSGPRGDLDMDLERQIFAPDARLIRMGLGEDGTPWRRVMTLEDYEEDTHDFLASTDFYEYETARQVVHCPPFAHVLSEYDGKKSLASDELLLSGVNSIQCLHDGKRWWVYQLSWNHRA